MFQISYKPISITNYSCRLSDTIGNECQGFGKQGKCILFVIINTSQVSKFELFQFSLQKCFIIVMFIKMWSIFKFSIVVHLMLRFSMQADIKHMSPLCNYIKKRVILGESGKSRQWVILDSMLYIWFTCGILSSP